MFDDCCGALESDLHKIARGRSDDYRRSHLSAHRHIVDRPGFANGDLKSKGALYQTRRDITIPKFVRSKQNSGVIGKLIEAEIEFRTSGVKCVVYRWVPKFIVTFTPYLV